MCGIAGFVGQGNQEDLAKMILAIEYRGPDDRGFLWRDNVGLAQCRLSIIDLTPAGHQPMSNHRGDIWLAFNGEIYNFQELKSELERLGKYQFKSKSDTEVIIYLYEEFGESAFSKMDGMFALALYDFRLKKMILARDRLGKKPLYWGIFNETLIFGSELKAILAHRSSKKELNLESLNKYLLYDYVPTPQTIFKNIHKLEPATYLVWQGGRMEKKRFWQLSFSPSKINFKEAIGELERLIDNGVKERLMADVPLGIFLSGGIDSGAVAYFAQKNSGQKIKTFSIGFEESSFDESVYARKISDFLKTEHYHQVLTAKDSLDLIPNLADFIDEPLADPSVIPTYLLSKFTKNYVTVALGGDGGDELFAGYPTFQAEKLVGWYRKIPSPVRKLIIEKIINQLPASEKNFSWEFKLKKFLEGANQKNQYRHQDWLGSFDRPNREKLILPGVWRELKEKNEYEEIDGYFKESGGFDFNNQLLYLYLRTYLMDQVLVKVDRMSMSVALEVRAPFLDYQLVEFVSSLPFNYKLNGLTTKYIFKKLMADKLPSSIVNRAKKGFGVPLARWLKNELKDWCDEILAEAEIVKGGLFNFSFINKLKQDHFSGREDNHKKLWNLVIWQLWQNKWLRK